MGYHRASGQVSSFYEAQALLLITHPSHRVIRSGLACTNVGHEAFGGQLQGISPSVLICVHLWLMQSLAANRSE
jgi:hypothetical protein